jgi:putative transposase
MSRPLRLEFAGAFYHITSRGNRRENIYETDDDREMFLALLGDVCQRYHWRCHAYCLMSNHYHLLIETIDATLSQGIRQLNGVYTQRLNRAHGRVGHVFQGRFKAILVDKNAYFLQVSRYIVLNPVRAKMVAQVTDWPWSSYHGTCGNAVAPEYLETRQLLNAFSAKASLAVARYKQFVGAGISEKLWEGLQGQVFLGDDVFVAEMKVRIHESAKSPEIPAPQHQPVPISLEDIDKPASCRNEAIIMAHKTGAFTLKTIGDHFGLHYSTIGGIIRNHKS